MAGKAAAGLAGRLLVGIALETGLGAGQEQLVDARLGAFQPAAGAGIQPCHHQAGRAHEAAVGAAGQRLLHHRAPRSARPGWAACP